VYWLQRPPYLRWAAAVLLVAGALWWDLRPEPLESRPFASRALEQGEPVADAVEWREIPAGLWPLPDISDSVAAVAIAAGEPITASAIAGPVTAPEGWWSVPVTVGTHADTGDTVMLMILDPPATVPGLVLAPQAGDPYSLDFQPAVVAVPGDAAALVAMAAEQDLLVTAVRP
jgi:hypothetical protein